MKFPYPLLNATSPTFPPPYPHTSLLRCSQADTTATHHAEHPDS